MNTRNQNNALIYSFIAAKFLLQFALVNPAYELQRDEYLHLDQGRHLAAGYISVPPVTSWIAWLINILGKGEFWVKFFPALFGAATMWLVCKLIQALGGKTFAIATGALAVMLSVVLRINMLFQPNSLDIFFWTLLYFTIVKYISSGNARWLLAAGAAAGFGLLSKYNMTFLLAGLCCGALFTRQRKVALVRHFYFAIAIAAAIVFPNLLWQFQNDFPTLSQLRELSATQLVNVNRLDFLKDQFVYFFNVAPVLIAAFTAFVFYPPFRKYMIVPFSFLITISLFIFLKAKSYYAIGLYPVLFAFGSVYLENLKQTRQMRTLKWATPVWIIALSIPFIYLTFPIHSPAEIRKNPTIYKRMGLLRWEDGKDHALPQDFADMLGWKELAAKVDAAYRSLPDSSNVLVLCDNYGQAGAINYYSAFPHMNAVSLNADYINWIPLNRKIEHLILIQYADDDDPERHRERPWFDTVFVSGKINNVYCREFGSTIYTLRGATVDINAILRTEIAKIRGQRRAGDD